MDLEKHIINQSIWRLKSELTEREEFTNKWYDQNGEIWSGKRRKNSEPSFWASEYEEFKLLKNTGHLLEIGSGSGREAIEWLRAGYEYTGVDVSQTLIKIAQKTEPKGQYIHSSIYDMPFAHNIFDGFSSWAMLPHIPKNRLKTALQGIVRVLKINAIGFIAMREGTEERQEPETGRWFAYYSLEEMEKVLSESGFEIIKKGKKQSRPDLIWLTFFVKIKS